MRNPGTPGRPRVPARFRVPADDRAYSRVPRTRGPGLRGTPRNLTPERTRDRARVLPRCFARVLPGDRAYSRECASREWPRRTDALADRNHDRYSKTGGRCDIREMSASAAGRRTPRRTIATGIEIEGEAPRHGRRGGGSHGHSSCITEDSDSAERGWNGAERGT